MATNGCCEVFCRFVDLLLLCPCITFSIVALTMDWMVMLPPNQAPWSARSFSLWKTCQLQPGGARCQPSDQLTSECTFSGSSLGGLKAARALYITGIIFDGINIVIQRLFPPTEDVGVAVACIAMLFKYVSSAVTIAAYIVAATTFSKIHCSSAMYSSRAWLPGRSLGLASLVLASTRLGFLVLGVVVACVAGCCDDDDESPGFLHRATHWTHSSSFRKSFRKPTVSSNRGTTVPTSSGGATNPAARNFEFGVVLTVPLDSTAKISTTHATQATSEGKILHGEVEHTTEAPVGSTEATGATMQRIELGEVIALPSEEKTGYGGGGDGGASKDESLFTPACSLEVDGSGPANTSEGATATRKTSLPVA